MNSTANIIRLAITFGILMLMQVLIFNNLDLVNLCNPFIYVAFIMTLPIGTPPPVTMLISLLTGLTVDITVNTPGMHAAACVAIAYFRPMFFKLIAFRTGYKEDELPLLHTYGLAWYFKYTIMMVSLHHIILFLVEQYDTFFAIPTLIRIAASIAATTVLVLLFGMAQPKHTVRSED